eukprot:scaffold550_cov44-Attheya_sp.AAC.1
MRMIGFQLIVMGGVAEAFISTNHHHHHHHHHHHRTSDSYSPKTRPAMLDPVVNVPLFHSWQPHHHSPHSQHQQQSRHDKQHSCIQMLPPLQSGGGPSDHNNNNSESEEEDSYRDILDEAVALYASLATMTNPTTMDVLSSDTEQHQDAIMTLVEDATMVSNERSRHYGPMTEQELLHEEIIVTNDDDDDDMMAFASMSIQERLDKAVLYASSSKNSLTTTTTTTEETERIMSTIVSLAKEYHSLLHSHDNESLGVVDSDSDSDSDSSHPVVHHPDEALQELRRRLEHIKASINHNANVTPPPPATTATTTIATKETTSSNKDEDLNDYHFASKHVDEPEKEPPPNDVISSRSISNTHIMEQPNESSSGNNSINNKDDDAGISSFSVDATDMEDSSRSNGMKEERTRDTDTTASGSEPQQQEEDVVDVAIVGAGIGGLCAGAILNTLYGKTVGIYESHYLPGGCAHAFPYNSTTTTTSGKTNQTDSNQHQTFIFDSGPTIVLGCSAPPYNPLRQVLNVVGLGTE